MKKPLALIILDGFGIAGDEGNAIKTASTPNIDRLFSSNPITQIGASGMDVGLPDGQMGNSEVGHTNIGAGRVVYQELTRITKSINDGDFFENEALVNAVDNAIKNKTDLLAPGKEGINGLTISNAIHLSGWTGETVDVKNFPHDRFFEILQEKIQNSIIVKKESHVVADTAGTY